MKCRQNRCTQRSLIQEMLLLVPWMLLAWIGPAIAEKPKGQYVLIRNEDPVCAQFTRNLNEFREIDPDVCHSRLSPNYPEFSRPEWREVPLDWWVVETFFNLLLLDPALEMTESNKKSAQVFWQAWQQQARPLEAQGKLRMWRTEVDVDHDGEIDPVLRVERIIPNALAFLKQVPLEKRDCGYQYSGLHFVNKPKVPLYAGASHFSFEGTSDLISSSVTRRTYALRWMQDMKYYSGAAYNSANFFPAPKGATRGVSVGLARSINNDSPMGVCYIAWVPAGVSTKLTPDQLWKRQR